MEFRNTHITEVNSFEEFKDILENKTGFVSAHWDGTAETEEKIKDLNELTLSFEIMEYKIGYETHEKAVNLKQVN